VQSKVDEMRQNMEGYHSTTTKDSAINSGSKSQTKPNVKGDYIDFEEIK
jgi:hypothetical protein